ncbi:hypothetical protein DRW42_09440 [Pedobacter miscanthi]|uniref:Uncharacterized protein n=1 Tax=Pedobacter miscanthi TaxID=2259170 RepID=A0A366L1R8_9SPHI|nr:hypothetical protein DRW42_09440 [Pedobacter miscanthi]
MAMPRPRSVPGGINHCSQIKKRGHSNLISIAIGHFLPGIFKITLSLVQAVYQAIGMTKSSPFTPSGGISPNPFVSLSTFTLPGAIITAFHQAADYAGYYKKI